MSEAEDSAIGVARRVLAIEARSVAALADSLDASFGRAVDAVLRSRGRVIVSGMGKSGIVAHKIAATLMSTGTPSGYLHPGEAYHGDLGMVTPDDVVLAVSKSGETEEVVKLLPYLRENGNPLIAMTGAPRSTIARAAAWHLDVSVAEEACALQLAPTSSTTAALAMGDAFAVALMEARGFSPEDFARFHPGGALGRRLLARVDDEMRSGDLPMVSPTAGFVEVLRAVTASGLGLTLVGDGGPVAIITDGDLRRVVERLGPAVFDSAAGDFMTLEPSSVPIGTRMEDAIAKMDRDGIGCLLVTDGDAIVGIVKK